MDHEFHYYMTYLIAARSGFNKKDAETLAYSSQYIDNNDHIFNISPGTDNHYQNYISQTKNITMPRKKLFRIYPIFHFVPGKVLAKDSRRKDGKLHYLNTTPDNKNANQILDSALETNNLYKIGLAVHAFADTYAQQKQYGGTKVEKYNKYQWLDRVLANPVKISWFKLQREIPLIPIPVIIEVIKDKIKDFFGVEFSFKYSWKDKNNYKNSHWYRFQKAVKELQEEAETILENNTLSKMELEEL